MSAPECERTDDVAAYALGALGPEEASKLSAHLAQCEECAAALEWLRPAVETLPASVEQVAPPPELRASLLATVQAEAGGPERSGWRGRRLHIGGFAFGPATALAALLIVVAAAVGYGIGQPGANDDTRTIPVASRQPGSRASLELTKDAATLQAHDVPQLPPGSVYQVWVQTGGGAPRASSTFRPSVDGTAAAAVPEALHGADLVMVTRESSEGRAYPSERPIYAVKIPN
jgi:anti-sigma-K factor RskA